MALAGLVTGSGLLGGAGLVTAIGSSMLGASLDIEHDRRRWIGNDAAGARHEADQLQRMLQGGDRSAELARRLLAPA